VLVRAHDVERTVGLVCEWTSDAWRSVNKACLSVVPMWKVSERSSHKRSTLLLLSNHRKLQVVDTFGVIAAPSGQGCDHSRRTRSVSQPATKCLESSEEPRSVWLPGLFDPPQTCRCD
jgi:hypothetical protein